ncbi:hypothetical protein Tco_1189586, partial [Tanacetum coccineum]
MPGIEETAAANWFVCLNSEKSVSKVFSLWSNPNKEPKLGRSCREELGTVVGVGAGVCCRCVMRGIVSGGRVAVCTIVGITSEEEDASESFFRIGLNSTLLYKSRQTTIPFPSRLDNHYCKEGEGNYRLKFTKAYGASHINNTIPRKDKDPWSFNLPCFINDVCFDNALVDLGANVSVMPLSTYLKLGLCELAHTRLTMELADRTVKYPKGIAKNVLVEISKFTFIVDFIILDMPKDIKVPLILRRLFLSTARAKIDVYKRKITLRVEEEKII